MRRGRDRRLVYPPSQHQAHRHLRHRAAGAEECDADVQARRITQRGDAETRWSTKRVEVVYDDGRHFIRTTREKFDIITSDPIDPWVKGCAALNTVEYYEMCKAHLNPGGVMSLWIPFYESNRTRSRACSPLFQGLPQRHPVEQRQQRRRLRRRLVRAGRADAFQRGQTAGPIGPAEDDQPVQQSLEEVGFHSAVDLLATYAARASDFGVDARRANQHRPEPAAPVSGRHVVELVHEPSKFWTGSRRTSCFPTTCFRDRTKKCGNSKTS